MNEAVVPAWSPMRGTGASEVGPAEYAPSSARTTRGTTCSQ